jgi:DTW domain-containing protein YfiP
VSPRPRCAGCGLPLRNCLCAQVRAVASPLPLTVLQHPEEAQHAKGTARLLQRCLGEACRLHVGTQFAPEDGWLLYPEAEAAAPPPGRPPRLLLLDGSWRQSRALLRANPWLLRLPRYALQAPPPSRYGLLRKAHRPQQLSTLEAAAQALAELGGDPAARDALLAAMDGWLRQQLDWRQPR